MVWHKTLQEVAIIAAVSTQSLTAAALTAGQDVLLTVMGFPCSMVLTVLAIAIPSLAWKAGRHAAVTIMYETCYKTMSCMSQW